MTTPAKIEQRREPHKSQLGCWWYEDKTGIQIYNTSGMVSRILWKHLIPAAKRCGRNK